MFKMKTMPSETPEQVLPDAESIQMACRVSGVMSSGEFLKKTHHTIPLHHPLLYIL